MVVTRRQIVEPVRRAGCQGTAVGEHGQEGGPVVEQAAELDGSGELGTPQSRSCTSPQTFSCLRAAVVLYKRGSMGRLGQSHHSCMGHIRHRRVQGVVPLWLAEEEAEQHGAHLPTSEAPAELGLEWAVARPWVLRRKE